MIYIRIICSMQIIITLLALLENLITANEAYGILTFLFLYVVGWEAAFSYVRHKKPFVRR